MNVWGLTLSTTGGTRRGRDNGNSRGGILGATGEGIACSKDGGGLHVLVDTVTTLAITGTRSCQLKHNNCHISLRYPLEINVCFQCRLFMSLGKALDLT